jgi:hypothetical protein
MDFQIVQSLRSAPDRVGAALVDPAFLRRMVELPKLGSAEVVAQARTGDVVEQQVRYLFRADLSGAVTKVVDPDRLTWVEDSSIDLARHVTRCEIIPDFYANLLAGRYDARIEPEGGGARRTITGALKVKVPVVGGRVERAIVGGLRENAAAQAALIDEHLGG